MPAATVEAPVGRGREWRDLTAVVDSRQSAVLVIAGPAGSGRTHLLNALGEFAAQRGYFVLAPERALPSLQPTSTMNDIHRALSAVLGEAPAPDAVGLLEQSGTEVPGQPAPGAADTTTAGHAAAAGTRASFWHRVERLLRSAGQTVQQSVAQHMSIVSLFRERAPLLLGVDGYRPSELVHTWIVNGLLPALRALEQPVILVFADRMEFLEGVRRHAAVTCELGPLDVSEVAEHLRRLSAGLVPPMADDELRLYAGAVAQDPSLLQSFEAVFELADRAEQ